MKSKSKKKKTGGKRIQSDLHVVEADPSKVINLVDVRTRRWNEERRNMTRFFLQELVEIYCVIEGGDLIPIELVEASEKGCSFRVQGQGHEELPKDISHIRIRIYFGRDNYLALGVDVVNVGPALEGGQKYVRYGCAIDQSYTTYEAYQGFLNFIDLYAKHATQEPKRVIGL